MKLKKILKRMMFDERIEIYWAQEHAELYYIGWAGEFRDFHKEDLNQKLIAVTRSEKAIRLLIKKND